MLFGSPCPVGCALVCCVSAIGVCVSVKIFSFECIIKPSRNFTDRDSLYKHLELFSLLLFAFRLSLLSLWLQLLLLLLLSLSVPSLTLHTLAQAFLRLHSTILSGIWWNNCVNRDTYIQIRKELSRSDNAVLAFVRGQHSKKKQTEKLLWSSLKNLKIEFGMKCTQTAWKHLNVWECDVDKQRI